ncbi:TatD family hydrolase [Chloroflexota bacterium]
MIYSDSHCHLDGQPGRVAGVIEQAGNRNVGIMVTMGMTLESSAEAINLTQSYDSVLAAVGIHPWNPVLPTDEFRQQFDKLARSNDVIEIGEIGLDYLRSPETKDIQKELLEYELSIALELNLPVSVHCRESHNDLMDIIRPAVGRGLRGSLHEGAHNWVEFKDWLDLGFYVTAGVRSVTNESSDMKSALAKIPIDRLLTETDGTAYEGSIGPQDVVEVVDRLANIRNSTAEEIAGAATNNLKHLLNLQ